MNAGKVILAALVIYLAGVLTGHFASGLSDRNRQKTEPSRHARPRPMMHDLVRRIESRLDLSSSQRDQVREIVEASQHKMRKLRDTMRPRFEAESRSMRLQIEAILNESQIARFDKIFKHRRRDESSRRQRRPRRPEMEPIPKEPILLDNTSTSNP